MGTIEETNNSEKCIFFDISLGERKIGRIVVKLFVTEAPKTTAHTLELLDKYKGTYFHRVIKNFMIQGGDVVNGLATDYGLKKAGEGKYALVIEDENLQHPLDKPFFLCMANSGPNTNGSQFFITTASASHLTGKNTVFGEVIHGRSVVREIERVSTSSEGVPIKNELPIITDCGCWQENDPIPIYNACYDSIGGDIYEEYPDDDESIAHGSIKSAFNAASIIKDSGGALFKRGDYSNAFFKYKKSLRYVMEYIPDIDLEPDHYKNFMELKKKLFLNLSLVTLKLKDLGKCCEYGTYLMDMDLTKPEKAKTCYRMGCAKLDMKKYEEAVLLLRNADSLASDASTKKELERAENLLKKKKETEKAKFSKMFG